MHRANDLAGLYESLTLPLTLTLALALALTLTLVLTLMGGLQRDHIGP